MAVKPIEVITPGHFITALLQTSGGSVEMNVDGSITPVVFEYTVPDGFKFLWERGLFTMSDAAKVMDATEFGPLPALTNGVTAKIVTANGGDHADFTAQFGGFKRNADFTLMAGPDVSKIADGKGISIRWTISKATGGRPMILESGWKIRMEVNDNLTAIDQVRAVVQGMKIGNTVSTADVAREH
jgi:hypothetical protein